MPPKGFASLAKANVQFQFDGQGNCTLVCIQGDEPFELLGIDQGATMDDVMMHISLHVAEYHPESKNH